MEKKQEEALMESAVEYGGKGTDANEKRGGKWAAIALACLMTGKKRAAKPHEENERGENEN